MESDRERRIREKAYDIWVREGRPHGRDAEHWQKAEAAITSAEDMAMGAAARRAIADSGAGGEMPVRSRRAAEEAREGGKPGANARRGRKPAGS
ncbi:MAG: DUF2934 domain-containing protein [Stellaceae bacterium]